MLLKRVVQNKYKIMIFIICLYLLADVIAHKGMVRVLLSKKFPAQNIDTCHPKNNNSLVRTGKEWVKAVNTLALMNSVDKHSSGVECDVYISGDKNSFNASHDNSSSVRVNLDSLLGVYQSRGLRSSIWLDIKNLRDSNYRQALLLLIKLREKFGLKNKLIIESNRANLLKVFSDSGFYTSFYAPVFNPYLVSDDSLVHLAELMTNVINHTDVNAISGSYFQYPFLHHYFPNYPILIWCPNDKFSIINRWFKKRLAASRDIIVTLYP